MCDIIMQIEVAKMSEIPEGSMKRVHAFGSHVLLANVRGRVYATQDDCGHQRASLSKGSLEGRIVTCPLHRAKFDVTTGKNIAGINFGMPPELVQKLPPEMVAMFQKTGELIADIPILPLKTYKVETKGESIFLDNGS
jgi:nitrite reductase/ring-hydroxylating ferredoxin subunit